MNSPRTYTYLGTLGDSFMAFCRLYDFAKNQASPVLVKRYAYSFDDIEKPVEAFFKLIPYIRYQRVVPTPTETPYEAIKRDHGLFLSDSEDYGPTANFEFNPFPVIETLTHKNPYSVQKKTIGIQLHAGKSTRFQNKNYKGLDLDWVQTLVNHLPRDQFDICLLGTGAGYNTQKITLFCKKNSILNGVGTLSFEEWLIHLKYLDFLITPDGFSAFFACSQRVYSLVFYSDPDVPKCYLHTAWKAFSEWHFCTPQNKWQSRLGRLFGKPYQYYRPFSVDHVLRFIQERSTEFT